VTRTIIGVAQATLMPTHGALLQQIVALENSTFPARLLA